MAGQSSEHAEITRVLLQPLAKVPLPEPVHDDAGEHRILWRRQPIGESFNAAFAEIDLGRREWPTGLHGLILLGSIGLSAGQDVALLERPRAIPFHSPKGR